MLDVLMQWIAVDEHANHAFDDVGKLRLVGKVT